MITGRYIINDKEMLLVGLSRENCTRLLGPTYPKCLMWSRGHSVTTDVRSWWPACPKWEQS